MAVLPDEDRADISADFMRRNADDKTYLAGVLKGDIRAAINAADDWVNANAAAFNNALPTAAKNNLTAAQKARLLMFVVEKRFIKGV